MDVRPADAGDRGIIREIARQSFQTSFSLSPGQIDAIVEDEFSDAALADRIDDQATRMLVAEQDGSVIGFIEVELDDGGTIKWLHVDPGHRGESAGTALVDRIQSELAERDSALSALVLDAASEGGEFLERFGLRETDSVSVELGGERLHETVFAVEGRPTDPNEPAVDVPPVITLDANDYPLDRDDPIPGTDAPFFPMYSDEEQSDRYGFFCSNCGSTDVSVDGLERMECGRCGNTHLADDWDSAYL